MDTLLALSVPELALFGPAFWIFVVLVSIAITAGLVYDNSLSMGATLIIAVVILFWVFNVPFVTWITEHPWTLGKYMIGYLGAAAVVSVAKWTLYNWNRRVKYEETLADWLQREKLKELSKEREKDWVTYLKRNRLFTNHYGNELRIKALARENKERIITWMAYWPWVVMWALLEDLLKNVFTYMQRGLATVMDGINNHIYRNIKTDFDLGEDDE